VETRQRHKYTEKGEDQRKRQKRRYSPAFKAEALALYEQSDKSARQLEDELGITHGRLLRWRQQARRADIPVSNPSTALEAEVRRLQREVALLRQDQAILKKALEYCSAQQP
jgi:transposase